MVFLLAPADRRRRLMDGLEPVIERIGTAIERGDAARVQLHDTRPIAEPESSQLEVRVASLLTRRPDLAMGEIAEELQLTTAGRRQLSVLLRGHPAFELSSRYGWSVGRFRDQLATAPRGFRVGAQPDGVSVVALSCRDSV